MPSRPETREPRRTSSRAGGASAATSIVPGTSFAPQSSTISRDAIRWARMQRSGCSCFSKREEASERRPSRREVRRMLVPFQLATSSRTLVVSSETSETWPPMIPAMPEGPFSSQTRTVSASKRRSSPSRVVIVSPSSAARTVSAPFGTLSRSKACRGCAVSSIT